MSPAKEQLAPEDKTFFKQMNYEVKNIVNEFALAVFG